MTEERAASHQDHLDRLENAYQRLAEKHGYDSILIYSGAPRVHYADDQAATFRSYAHFLHWVPLPGLSHSWLWIRPADTPRPAADARAGNRNGRYCGTWPVFHQFCARDPVRPRAGRDGAAEVARRRQAPLFSLAPYVLLSYIFVEIV
jgi:hypothetical protein